MEFNFFHNQPESVKESVSFVASRLASRVNVQVQEQLVPEAYEPVKRHLWESVKMVFMVGADEEGYAAAWQDLLAQVSELSSE